MIKNSFIGIDLGTTFSAIAYVNEHGVPEVIENSEGERTTPSVVLFDGNEIHVGSYAKDNMSVYPGQGVEFVKRYMGEKLWSFEYNGRTYNASQISSFILKKLKEDAEAKLGTSIKDVVITVPAYFGDPQRRATIEAGELAGLNVVQVINEPTAAAYSYGLHKLGKDQRILVFDLGGGTFDVTVMEITGERIEVKATNGDHQLGGKDWDEALIQYIAEKFERAYKINPYSYEADYQTLKEKALAAKISLSTLPKANINYGCKGKTLKEEITRHQFEEITSRLVNQCRMLTELVLNEAEYKAGDIDIVLLAGGSTRMPMVVEMLKRYFGKDPSKALNPDECVALGASVKAAFLKKEKWFLPGEKKTWALPSGMKDINVTSHSFGLAVLNEGELYNSIIIPKNSPYPCDLEKSDYVTSYDDQETLDVYVLEGEAEDPRDCELVGSYQIYDIPKRPEGKTRLKMTYKYNENQIVEASAVDLHSNKVLPMRMIENPDLNQIHSSLPVDIIFALDYTGSMGPYIEGVKTNIFAFVDELVKNSVSWKLGFVGFGDVLIGEPITKMELIESAEKFKQRVATHPMLCGGDEPESQIDALFEAVDMKFSSQSQIILILITDASPHDPDGKGRTSKDFLKVAKKKNAVINIVGPNLPVYRDIANSTGGILIDISNTRDMRLILDMLSQAVVNLATQVTSGAHISKGR